MKPDFKLSIPVELCEKTDKGWKIRGVASTEDRDLQGEIVKQNGLDFSHIKQGLGLFNWNHKNDPQYILGKIDNATVQKDKTVVEGYLFEHQDNAKAIINIMRSLQPGDKHRVQMSIEGKIIDRGGSDNKTIKSARIEKVALTLDAVNQNTYTEFAKSLLSDEAIEPEEEQLILKAEVQRLDAKIDELSKMLTDERDESDSTRFKGNRKQKGDDEEETSKMMTAGYGDGAPGTRSGGSAISEEDLDYAAKIVAWGEGKAFEKKPDLKKPDYKKAFDREDIINLLYKSVLLKYKALNPDTPIDSIIRTVDQVVADKLEKAKKPSMLDELDEYDINEKYSELKTSVGGTFDYENASKFDKLHGILTESLKSGNVGKVRKLQTILMGCNAKLKDSKEESHKETSKKITEFATSLNSLIEGLTKKQKELSERFEGKETAKSLLAKAKELPIGTIRSWGGVDYKKEGKDDWRPVSHSKGESSKEEPKAERKKEGNEQEKLKGELKELNAKIQELSQKKEEAGTEKGKAFYDSKLDDLNASFVRTTFKVLKLKDFGKEQEGKEDPASAGERESRNESDKEKAKAKKDAEDKKHIEHNKESEKKKTPADKGEEASEEESKGKVIEDPNNKFVIKVGDKFIGDGGKLVEYNESKEFESKEAAQEFQETKGSAHPETTKKVAKLQKDYDHAKKIAASYRSSGDKEMEDIWNETAKKIKEHQEDVEQF